MAMPQPVGAVCETELSSGEGRGPLVIRLSPNCLPAEREAHVVESATVLDALAKGWAVDLVGAVVQGDLILDRLSVQTLQPTNRATSEVHVEELQPAVEERRLVREAITIRDSVVKGAIRHRSPKGILRFEGSMDIRGTTFKEAVDLSRSEFHGPVLLSGARFEKEAFFIQGRFGQALECKDTKFGIHTRFHRSVFRGPLDCTGALFDGMAEFLEVNFEAAVVFERARFGSGTGFSGSRFTQLARFDEAIFSRDAFFAFTVFGGGASFAGAQFLGRTDFSDAEFTGQDHLAQARFDEPPLLARTKRMAQDQSGLMNSPAAQYGLTVLFLAAAALLVGYLFKMR
jgi:hypothetical protein